MSAPTPWWVGPILENSVFKSNHYYCFYGVNNLRWSCMRVLHYIEYPVWTLRWFINWEGEISDTTTFIVWGHLLFGLFQLVTAPCGCWARLGGQVKRFPTVTLIQVLVWPLEDFLFFHLDVQQTLWFTFFTGQSLSCDHQALRYSVELPKWYRGALNSFFMCLCYKKNTNAFLAIILLDLKEDLILVLVTN